MCHKLNWGGDIHVPFFRQCPIPPSTLPTRSGAYVGVSSLSSTSLHQACNAQRTCAIFIPLLIQVCLQSDVYPVSSTRTSTLAQTSPSLWDGSLITPQSHLPCSCSNLVGQGLLTLFWLKTPVVGDNISMVIGILWFLVSHYLELLQKLHHSILQNLSLTSVKKLCCQSKQ